jgi:hypothetical protein
MSCPINSGWFVPWIPITGACPSKESNVVENPLSPKAYGP